MHKATDSRDPLLNLWVRLGRALAPFGVPVERDVLELWRDQWGHGGGPLWQAERGDTSAIDDAIAILRELRGPDPEDGEAGAD